MVLQRGFMLFGTKLTDFFFNLIEMTLLFGHVRFGFFSLLNKNFLVSFKLTVLYLVSI